MPIIGFFRGLGHLLLFIVAFPLWLVVMLVNGRKEKVVVVSTDGTPVEAKSKKGMSSGTIVALIAGGAILLLLVANAGCAVRELTAREQRWEAEWLRCAKDKIDMQLRAVARDSVTSGKARESAERWIESSCGETRRYPTEWFVRQYIKL